MLATSGIDALDSYFARYLPQLFLAVIVPVTVILVVLGHRLDLGADHRGHRPADPGVHGARRSLDRGPGCSVRPGLLERLAGHFLDVVAGLPTLKVFGRAKAQVAAIRDITDRYRTATMATLKVAFLSSLILELLATFSVALVAVAVGLRLLGGHLTLASALFVLILAPRPTCRCAGSARTTTPAPKGCEAAEDVFEVLERPLPTRGTRTRRPRPVRGRRCGSTELEVRYPGRALPGAAAGVPDGGSGRGRGDRRAERLREVDPAQRPARP